MLIHTVHHEAAKKTKAHEGSLLQRCFVCFRFLRVSVTCRVVLGRACLGSVLPLIAVGVANAELIDRVLAVVNGDLITLSDVRGAGELGLVAPGSAADPIQAVLAQLIDRALELDEVDRFQPPEPSAGAVDREVQAVRSRFPSPAAFDAAMTRAGLDLQRLRETLRDNLRIRAYLEQRFLAADDRRQPLIADWLTGLRGRAEIVDLYRAGP